MIAVHLNRIGGRIVTRLLLAVAGFHVLLPAFGSAQAIPAASSTPPWSRYEFYAGYAFLNAPNSSTSSYKEQPQLSGLSLSAANYFDHYFGIQGQADLFPSSGKGSVVRTEAGPSLRFPIGAFVPSLHMLVGTVRAEGPQAQSQTWGPALSAGAAIDYVPPRFGFHLSMRLIQADFDYAHISYSAPISARVAGFLSQLSAGVVYRSGEAQVSRPVQLGCTADLTEVFPGEPITITAHLLEGDHKRRADFHWISSGGHSEGTGAVIRVDTRAVVPGDYVVTGTVHQGRRRDEQSQCTIEFRVLKPDTSANPSAEHWLRILERNESAKLAGVRCAQDFERSNASNADANTLITLQPCFQRSRRMRIRCA